MEQWPLPATVADFTVLPLVCINGPLTEINSELSGLIQSSHGEGCWRFSEVAFNLKGVYHVAPPRGGAHFPKFLLWEPEGLTGKTAMICNVTDCLQRRIMCLSETYYRDCFRVLLSRDHQYLPECQFEFFGRAGGHRRIEVFNDGRWEFRSEGSPLPFENQESYRARAVRDRLTPSIVAWYLSELGWDIRRESFWSTNRLAFFGEQLEWGPNPSLEDLLPEL